MKPHPNDRISDHHLKQAIELAEYKLKLLRQERKRRNPWANRPIRKRTRPAPQ